MVFKFPSFKTIVVGFVFSIIAIQVVSLLLNQIFNISVIKTGNAMLIMLIGIGIVTLFNISFNLEQLKQRETLVFILIIFGLIALAFYKGQEYLPQIFSISPEVSNTIKQTVGAIINP